MSAKRTVGYDEDDQPCYCAFHYVLTTLKSDDGELFYEAPEYAEALSSWRLRDERWLIYREVIANPSAGFVQKFFTLSDSMPR